MLVDNIFFGIFTFSGPLLLLVLFMLGQQCGTVAGHVEDQNYPRKRGWIADQAKQEFAAVAAKRQKGGETTGGTIKQKSKNKLLQKKILKRYQKNQRQI
jgi:hypothetical protein